MEEERTREELVNEINELALTETADLAELPEQDGGSADMLIGAAVGTGITALIAGGVWLWNRHKRKKAEKKGKNAKLDEEWNELVKEVEEASEEDSEPEPEEPKKESKKKDK